MADELAPEIRAYYDEGREGARLTDSDVPLELARTRELLVRFLPPAPARILDVGGGTGVYASWLADLGYDVHVVDPVPLHVDQALAVAGGRFTAAVGDARSLEAGDASADAVLLLGPLYHLTERDDRARALAEARRAVRPGGVVLAAAISRFASLLDGVARGMLAEPEFRTIVERDLAEGQHRNPDMRPGWFTTAFFHHPAQLETELHEAGLAAVRVVGVEGPGGWLADGAGRWADDGQRDALLHAARLVESEPALLGLSAHLLGVGRRPAGPAGRTGAPAWG